MTAPMPPRSALSPRVMLATAMHSQPGVYALLLGSGVSTSTGIPTGWGVVKDLVAKIAAAADPDDSASRARAADDPEAWAAEHGIDLDYSGLLKELAATQSGRQGLLEQYFVPSEEQREQGFKVPGTAHKAIAELVKRGVVRVILTTNFDALMEQALTAAGVQYQVISRPDAVAGMTPLAHAGATVIKLHGDYRELDTRNTVDELDEYPSEWNELLGQIGRDYGLVVSGWSAAWDKALVRALAAAPMRYQLFWDTRSSKGEKAQELLAQHRGIEVPAESADALFGELLASVDALAQLAEPPLTTAMAIARLKRALPDPVRRIELHDLVMSAVDDVVAAVEAIPRTAPPDLELVDQVLRELVVASTPLLHLLIEGVHHDVDGAHTELWCDVLLRLMNAYQHDGYDRWVSLQHYPALLALRTMGLVAIRRDRPGLLVELLTRPRWRGSLSGLPLTMPAHVLNVHRVLDNWVNDLPRWNGQGWQYPASHLLKADLEAVFSDYLTGDEYVTATHDVEYLIGLVQQLRTEPGAYHAAGGEFIGGYRWVSAEGNIERPQAEAHLEERIAARGVDALGLAALFGDQEPAQALTAYREYLEPLRKYS